MAQYFTIPDIEFSEDEDKQDEIIAEINKYISDNNLQIKMGDLIRLESAYLEDNEDNDDNENKSTIRGNTYYRNDGLYIYNGNSAEELDFTIDDYGALSNKYRLFEAPNYFTKDHWHKIDESKNGTLQAMPYISHNNIVWITNNKQIRDNIEVDNINEYKSVIYTWYDVADKKHNIIYESSIEEPYSDELLQKFTDILREQEYLPISTNLEDVCPGISENLFGDVYVFSGIYLDQ